MTQEEKAKAYDDAIKRAKRMFSEKELNYLFPELAESYDEKIISAIRKAIEAKVENLGNGVTRTVCLAWLEKQCEKQQGKTTLEDVNEEKFDNANKVEPKFNLYDWVVTDKGDTVQIVAVNNGYYTLHNGMDFNMSYVDKCWRKWTIQDAKDGDVLAAHECLVLFREIDGLNIRCYCTYHFMNNPSFYVYTLQNKNAFHPASKEQRDKFEKAMADAGYAFDFDKKELKEIEDEEYNDEDYGIDGLWHAKNILEKTLGKVDGYQTDDGILDHKCAISAVNKLYEEDAKINNRWKPSDEHIHWLKWVINRMPDTEKANEAEVVLKDLLEQLEEL